MINGKENRKEIFDLLLFLYLRSLEVQREARKRGIETAREQHRYRGRKPIPVDPLLFERTEKRVQDKEITLHEGARELDITVDNYYRLRKKAS